jgi:hypothetical protein
LVGFYDVFCFDWQLKEAAVKAALPAAPPRSETNVATLWTLYPSNTRSRVTLHAWGLSPPPPPERRKSKVAAVATLRLRAPASERGERWVGGRGREVEGGSAEALAKMYNMMMIVASDVATNQSCQELRSRAGRG